MGNFLKIQADDNPEIFLQGVFAVMYWQAVVTDRDLYVGRCDCQDARRYDTKIFNFSPKVRCAYCGKMVQLDPVPRPDVQHE